jgi:hypothetical protein
MRILFIGADDLFQIGTVSTLDIGTNEQLSCSEMTGFRA